ncbi:cytidyltransferase [Capnocytophaga cynodegmi]|uniref:Cytidyltransferase n=1 Tax=Capnocytophaga cynodegmi TaxID=28189 RepID=A0A250E9W5_9FLAO|nr:adenylyltransferase/cytidyltransferase family protein [Capnocytophaga cynodegmi]ATA68506.1 cytidyltransferase [Capnocytophaga cynodegmi]
MKRKKIFVSGCYDMLHSGHVAFFEEASRLGDLYVGIGSDRTIQELKARKTINPEQERLYMVKSLRFVKDAWINSGSGILDFKEDMVRLKPDVLFVNEDGHSPAKEALCKELGIEYHVSKRIPHGNLPIRSTTALRKECLIPYRIDLAGGWLDQPSVSKFCPGPVITICIEPDYEFNDRSGMSTSTRKKAIELWHTDIPDGDKEHLAKILFSYENFPGEDYISGSQDALGIVLPGLNYYWYDGEFWPEKIEKNLSEDLLAWIENHLYLLPLQPRHSELHVTEGADISPEKVKKLSQAAQQFWISLLQKDLKGTGEAMITSFESQIDLFPNMLNDEIRKEIASLPETVVGYKLSGAGGGGYLVILSKIPIEKALRIRIRR